MSSQAFLTHISDKVGIGVGGSGGGVGRFGSSRDNWLGSFSPPL